MNLSSGHVSTIAGNTTGIGSSLNNGHADGAGGVTSFDGPSGIAIDGASTFAVVVRKLDETAREM